MRKMLRVLDRSDVPLLAGAITAFGFRMALDGDDPLIDWAGWVFLASGLGLLWREWKDPQRRGSAGEEAGEGARETGAAGVRASWLSRGLHLFLLTGVALWVGAWMIELSASPSGTPCQAVVQDKYKSWMTQYDGYELHLAVTCDDESWEQWYAVRRAAYARATPGQTWEVLARPEEQRIVELPRATRLSHRSTGWAFLLGGLVFVVTVAVGSWRFRRVAGDD